ncbi:thioesterase family protein [Staphylococcus aureus]|uniref:acyl-CoA thioesterase n=1 Tax=Staphylococcus aureus TaxID=1280 RepID=UPI002550441A|nr:thioesterase family protein [Staphylococcus aureus]MDK6416085.1 thioesterase family protein [Staphylococcus aureus]MDU9779435.1 thioesterase family protein [Staphylococcus aureus]MDU9828752.1 thioesterase family protein [Staphylococcus aureus]MDU9976620.1 thioesterase family protein [Staphylococcus aureus]MDU9986409.1 thioesterase family protein [Staphylococcus aureus]
MTTEGLLVAEKEIEVNGYDIDAMGVVSNIVYIRWFEDLRTAFINQHMNYSTMINQGISPILMKTEAEYKVPVTIHDKPVGRIYLVKVSKMKWVFQFEIVSAHCVHCIGTQTGGFYRLSDKKITSVPQVFQDILATK